MSSPSPFRLWPHLEERFCRTGETPASSDPNETLFRSIVRTNDARSAEAWGIQRKADPLLALRAHVYRGSLSQATALAARLTQDADGPAQSGEVLLERARIAALDGLWLESERLCSAALELSEIAPVSQITLFQIRALTFFETGRMALAAEDLGRIDSLAAIFPNSPSAFYAAVLRAKIVARDRGPAEGERQIQSLWTWLLRDPNLDRVHAMIRAELDLGRLAGRAMPGHLLASYRIAEITGEHLYSALAALEAAYSGIPALAAWFEPLVRDSARTFTRIRKLSNEIDSELEGRAEDASVTAATIAAASATATTPAHTVQVSEMLASLSSVSTLWFPGRQTFFQLSPFSAVRLEGQLLKGALALSNGPIPLETFFSRIWGRQRYSPELHANPMAALLYRLRKKTGARATVVAGQAGLQGTLVLR